MPASRPSITIGVAMHKPYRTPEDSMYLPIHVGAAGSPDVLTELAQDNTGENISALNNYFSELTALYWLWKNNDSDYKGIVHYRRYFATNNVLKWFKRDRFSRILGKDELLRFLENDNVIVPMKRRYFIETVQSHYAHTLYGEQLDETRKVLKNLNPEYVEVWDEVIHKRSAHIFNMMIMDKDTFNRYCEWLFPVLFELINRLDPAKYNAFHARYPGRVSEILLNVWLKKNNIKTRSVPTTYTEFIDWPKKVTGFLKAKFMNKKYSASF